MGVCHAVPAAVLIWFGRCNRMASGDCTTAVAALTFAVSSCRETMMMVTMWIEPGQKTALGRGGEDSASCCRSNGGASRVLHPKPNEPKAPAWVDWPIHL